MLQRLMVLIGMFLWSGAVLQAAPPVRVPAPVSKPKIETTPEVPQSTPVAPPEVKKQSPTVSPAPSVQPAPAPHGKSGLTTTNSPVTQESKPVAMEQGGTDPRRSGRAARRAKKQRPARETPRPLMESLRVMTYNLRFASTNQPNAWSDRRPAARALIQKYKPDVVGTQEGLYGQIRDMEQDLPAYSWIGLGREGGSKGEFMAVFYRRDRLMPLAFDHFWLSDTPLVMGSATWGNKVKRMVTWVRFRDLKSGTEFFCFNTHFDHQSEAARMNSAKFLGGMIASAGTNAPVVLLGDFNARLADSPVHETLVKEGGLSETWYYTREKRGELSGTFHDYGLVRQEMGRIDWILTRGPWECDLIDTPQFSYRGQRSSDHWPVYADLRLIEKGQPAR